MQDKILSLIGISAKAGSIQSGAFSAEKVIKSGRAYLVILAEDASDGTKKQFMNMCDYRNVPLYIYSDGVSLGKCIGKESRKIIAVTDEGFAHSLVVKLREVNA